VISQLELNEKWMPPPFNIGQFYAANLKTVALCLIYAPLWPFAYLLTAICLGLSYWSTKCAIAKWYRRPPMMSEAMMAKFRSRLGLLMLLHTIVTLMGATAFLPEDRQGIFGLTWAASGPVSAMFFLWCVYELLDVPNCFNLIPGLRAFNELVDGLQPEVNGDTLGIPFEDDVDPVTKSVLRLGVESKLRYETDEYVCPADKRHTIDYLVSRVFRHGFGRVEDGRDETGSRGGGRQPDAIHVEMMPSTYPPQPQPYSYPSGPATNVAQPQPYSYPSEPATYPAQCQPYPPHTEPQPSPSLYPNLYPEANGGPVHPQSPVSYPSNSFPRANHASM